ncbi:MAG: DNA repair protein RadA [Candidatus Aerophobetes bacterium]|nr:DNA repair protein RadA [Candidatus Aerophobetes bacterium]
MEKEKIRFICQNCGYSSFKWLGRCPECGKWNSFLEERIKKGNLSSSPSLTIPKSITEIGESICRRYSTHIGEFDRILGGGVVPGSLVLIGGEPGIGKSTLLLEVGDKLSSPNSSVLYISGEESVEQTKLRASRLGITSPHLYLLSETRIEIIAQQINNLKPRAAIIDSIQTMYTEGYTSSPGSISQIRESTAYLMKLAKQKKAAIFLIGHVTKEGAIAGPKILEHIVDTVLYFESEKNYQYRILRTVKNRFGAASEIGVFKMEEDGLKEIVNPSELFLEDYYPEDNLPGKVIVPTMEGSRTFLVEIQALVTNSNLPVPRRISQGISYNRLCLLLAVLEKRVGLRLYNQDVYINVAGGMKVSEPSCDLAIALSIASSFKDKPFLKKAVAMGEIGLGGEIRTGGFMERKLKEAVKLGFTQSLIPQSSLLEVKKNFSQMKLIEIRNIGEAIKAGLEDKNQD